MPKFKCRMLRPIETKEWEEIEAKDTKDAASKFHMNQPHENYMYLNLNIGGNVCISVALIEVDDGEFYIDTWSRLHAIPIFGVVSNKDKIFTSAEGLAKAIGFSHDPQWLISDEHFNNDPTDWQEREAQDEINSNQTGKA